MTPYATKLLRTIRTLKRLNESRYQQAKESEAEFGRLEDLHALPEGEALDSMLDPIAKCYLRGREREELIAVLSENLAEELIYNSPDPYEDILFEKMAACVHDIWTHWMLYLLSQSIDEANGIKIPFTLVDRWHRQMATEYEDLPDHERRSDREHARKIFKVIEENR